MLRNVLVTGVLAALIGAPASLAADITDIGYVDQTALANVKAFADANRQFNDYKVTIEKEYEPQLRAAHSQADQQKIFDQYQSKLADKQHTLLGPLFAKAQVAVASVASSKNLSVVVDRRIVIVGGLDITKNVIELLSGVGDPVPPANTPPPSSVGFVDQTEIDKLPKVKSAQDDFMKFQQDENAQLAGKFKSLKTDAERNSALKDAQKAIGDKQKALIDPIVDQTRGAIADVAKKKGLVLVIDKGNLIYGGTDITADVQSALK
jgi:outer membrane protein